MTLRRPSERIIKVIKILATDPQRLREMVEQARKEYALVAEPEYSRIGSNGLVATIRVFNRS